MAFIAVETLATRSYSVSGGQTTASRSFVCYDPVTAITAPITLIDNFGVSLPAIGDYFPSSTVAKATSYAISHREGTDQWEITWNYSSAQTTTTEKQPLEIGYVEVSIDYSAQFDDAYRDTANFPTDGTVLTESDIGGLRVDICGSPISVLRFKTEFSVTETVEYSTFLDIIQPSAFAAMGKRNDAVFQGAPRGSVVYRGASVRRIGVSLWQVSHSMQYDGYLHLIQVPIRDANGDIRTKTFDRTYPQAEEVYWRQPFASFANFSAISPNWS